MLNITYRITSFGHIMIQRSFDRNVTWEFYETRTSHVLIYFTLFCLLGFGLTCVYTGIDDDFVLDDRSNYP